jgi:hypothetical protein
VLWAALVARRPPRRASTASADSTVGPVVLGGIAVFAVLLPVFLAVECRSARLAHAGPPDGLVRTFF